MFQLLERSRVQAPLLLVGAALTLVSILVYTEGHLVAPLDDTYISLQYARRLAEGDGLRYYPGQPPTAGATSLLWCAMLTPPFFLGLAGQWGVLWAQVLSFGFFFVQLRSGVMLLRRRVAAPWRGVGVLVLLTSGPLYWAAASGMETMLYGALLLLALERFDRYLSSGSARGLVAVLFFLPLARPEGLATSLLVGLGLWKADGTRRGARFLVPGLGAICFSTLLFLTLTGSPVGSGLGAKSFFVIPHITSSEALRTFTGRFVSFLYDSMIFLDGGASMAFLTIPGGLLLAFAGMLSGGDDEHPIFYMVCDAVFTLGMAIPFVLDTVDSNHYRYHQALVPGLLVFVTLGLHEVYRSIPRAGLRKAMLGFLILFHLFGWRRWLFQLAVDCSRVYHQQVRMARWIQENLEEEALPALTDPGVLPYYSGRRFLDLLGLTTEGASPAFVRGAGASFEWLDHRDERPTHFCGHTRWWSDFEESGLLGAPAFEATLWEGEGEPQSRLLLAPFDPGIWGTAGSPCAPLPGRELVDELDVTLPAHEEAHDYSVRYRDGRDVVRALVGSGAPAGCGRIFEGGYPVSGYEEFTLSGLRPSSAAWLVLRVKASKRTALALSLGGERVETRELDGSPDLREVVFEVPAARVRGPRLAVRVEDVGSLHQSFHYWLYQ